MKQLGYGIKVVYSAGLFACIALLSLTAIAEVESPIDWERWAMHDASSKTHLNHRPLDQILQLSKIKRGETIGPNYEKLRDQGTADYVMKYQKLLEQQPVSTFNRDEQLAYWLNLHNIGVINMFIANKKAEKKVKKLRGLPGDPGAGWRNTIFTVEGHALSLEDIEQNILFRHWQDPLVLYGLCYGVKGSPAAGSKAFDGGEVHSQLRKIAKQYVNKSGNVKSKRKGVEVSSLYIWNKTALFNDDDALIVAHLQTLATGRLRSKLNSSTAVLNGKFNWRTSTIAPLRPKRNVNVGGGGGGIGGGGYGGGS